MSSRMLPLVYYTRKHYNVVRISVKYKQANDKEDLLIRKKCALSQSNETKYTFFNIDNMINEVVMNDKRYDSACKSITMI